MKFKALFLSLFSLLFLIACSSDSSDDTTDPDPNPQQTSNDVARSIAEYPNSGTVLSSLSSDLEGEVAYSLLSESVTNAFAITTDGLTVADFLVYDYEARTNITGSIQASNGTETETIAINIEINDTDDIWAWLGPESRASYEAASPGEWVSVLESEYNTIANFLALTTKSGATDADLFNSTSISSAAGNVTLSNVNEEKLPDGSYLIAFKYYSWINNSNGVQVKLSEGNFTGPFDNVGEALPEHNDEFNHFVLKGSNNPTDGEGYLGMYAPGNYGAKASSGAQFQFGVGNTSLLPNEGLNLVALHQGISTTLKQWD